MKIILKKIFLLFAVFQFPLCLFSQHGDSVQKRDTLAIYKKIKKIAYRHKATELLYHLVFVDPAPEKYNLKISDDKKKLNPNLKSEGKIIRKIEILVYDPFGKSVNDTGKIDINALQKIGNKYHVKTRMRVIRNLLLFKVNDTLEAIKITESERLIRQSSYVNDALIYVESIKNNDSVDVKVVVQDKWALDAFGSTGLSRWNLTLRDKNILGSGQFFQQYMSYSVFSTYELASRYAISNISDSHISSKIFYSATNDWHQAGISFDRNFFSSSTKWAGSLAFMQNWRTFYLTDTLENSLKKFPLNFYSPDVWLARSFATGRKKISNIILGARYSGLRFQDRPSFLIDTAYINLNNELCIGSVGFSINTYYKDKFIFRFGSNEDIPEGIVLQFSYGILNKELHTAQHYAGLDFSAGKYFDKVGYVSTYFNSGVFLNNSVAGNATLNSGITWFTNLLKRNRWYFRQFFYVKYVSGFNKSYEESVTLRTDELYGFNSGSLTGKSKFIVNFETISYPPYNLIGFRFAPVVLFGFGVLSDNQQLINKKVYQAYAMGLLIRNESLLFSSFKITFGFYPYLPDGNKNFFRFNPISSIAVRLRSFAVSKPTVINYN